MKLAFIGGNGHRYLAQLLPEAASHGITEVACAGDGMDDDRARAWFSKAQLNIPHYWFDDHQKMFDVFKPQAVNIGVRYGRNGDFIARALERDIAVCSDKPIAATWEHLERLKTLVKAKPSRVLLSEFPCRSMPAFRAARDAVRQGLIGQVVMATAQKSYRFGMRAAWYADRADYGGTVLWVASHAIDYIHFVTGLKYTSVSGLAGNVSKPEFGSMEEYTINTFTLENAGGAMVHADYNRPAAAPTHGDDRLRIVGSLGQLEVRQERCELITSEHGPADITGQAAVEPVSVELLDALTNADHPCYNTQASLATAGVMLAARDAADQRATLPVSM